jgi:ankyrin repeat protein
VCASARQRRRATVGDVRKDDVTAFTEAIWRRRADTIAALVARVDPNAPDRWSRTPLMMAAEFGDLALVATLVARGGDVDQKRTHLTPVTLAARRGDVTMVRFLRDHGAVMSIVTWIYLGDRAQVRRELGRDPALARLRDEGGTPLVHHAAEAMAPELLVLLLEHGAEVDARDENGEAPLHRVRPARGISAKQARGEAGRPARRREAAPERATLIAEGRQGSRRSSGESPERACPLPGRGAASESPSS